MSETVEVGTQTDLHRPATALSVEEDNPRSSRVAAPRQVLELNVGGVVVSVARATLTQVWKTICKWLL